VGDKPVEVQVLSSALSAGSREAASGGFRLDAACVSGGEQSPPPRRWLTPFEVLYLGREMTGDDLRAIAEERRREKAEAEAAQDEADRERREASQRQEDEYRRLVAEGRALLEQFLTVMRQNGNPGLRRSPGIRGRQCWDDWLAPSGEARVRSSFDGKYRWASPDHWLRRRMTRFTEAPESAQHSAPVHVSVPDLAGPKRLGRVLVEILAKNGVEV
jgi:hypothetical protein